MSLVLRGLIACALVFAAIWLFVVASSPADAAPIGDLVAQESPYQPPDLIQVDLPGWAQPLEPLARLPLWAQAALAAAFVGGLFYLVPAIGQWVYSLFGGEGTE